MKHLYESELQRFLDRTLGEEASARVEAHLGECLVCRRELEAQSAVLNLLNQVAEFPSIPRDLTAGILSEIQGLPVPVRQASGSPWPILAAASVLLLVGLALSWSGMAPAQDLAAQFAREVVSSVRQIGVVGIALWRFLPTLVPILFGISIVMLAGLVATAKGLQALSKPILRRQTQRSR